MLEDMQAVGLPVSLKAGDGIPDTGDVIFPVLDCGTFIIRPCDVNMICVQTSENHREHYGDVRFFIEVEKLMVKHPWAALLWAPGFDTLPYVVEWLAAH